MKFLPSIANFLTALDAGYATVAFRGQAASYAIASTERTIHVLVPPNDEGPAHVQVMTPHGSSNLVPFTIERPWWWFW